jgi:hypothetical protein
MVSADDSRFFQRADAAQARRCRNPGTPSQFDIGDTPLGLQTLQDSTVYRVELDPPHPMRPLQIAGS